MSVTNPRQFGLFVRKNARTRDYVEANRAYLRAVYPGTQPNEDEHLFALSVASNATDQYMEVAALLMLGCVEGLDFVRTAPETGNAPGGLLDLSFGDSELSRPWMRFRVDQQAEPWSYSLVVDPKVGEAKSGDAHGDAHGDGVAALSVAVRTGGRLDHISAHSFFLGNTTDARGNTFNDLLTMSDDDLHAYPEAWDWLFPAGDHFQPMSQAPIPTSIRLKDIFLDVRLRDGVALSFERFLKFCGLIRVGIWAVAIDERQRNAAMRWAGAASDFDRVIARVIACASMSGIAPRPWPGDPYDWDQVDVPTFLDSLLQIVIAERPGSAFGGPASWGWRR